MYVNTAWIPSISGFDTAGTAGTRSNLGEYCKYCIGNILGLCSAYVIAIISSTLFSILILRVLASLKYILSIRVWLYWDKWASEIFSAGNTRDTACTGLTEVEDLILLIYTASTGSMSYVYTAWTPSISILQVLQVLAEIWEDTASIALAIFWGNVLRM